MPQKPINDSNTSNFSINSCADIVDSQNPDNPNCQPVANASAVFPGCCPVLQCATASPLTTLSPTGRLFIIH